MAHTPGPGQAPAAGQARTAKGAAGPTVAVVYWRYLIFWFLFFGLIYLISLYGVVAEA